MPETDADRSSPHATTTEARAGSTPHMTRYVLTVGLILVIAAFAIVIWVGGS
ncbi:MAG TPA: hypothetical protein VE989_08210 [Sphingomicrobium sp.]|nr:hypothetical protein [Sphingomicrobium sp.]